MENALSDFDASTGSSRVQQDQAEGQAGAYSLGSQAYRAAGWSSPIPVGFGRRNAPPKGFTGEYGRDAEETDVRGWRAARGNDAVALRLPPGVVGIDVDAHDGKQGLETLRALEARHGPLPGTWSSTSREDGSRIMLFQAPGHITAVLRDLGPGIEVIRRAHRYAVVWPSVSEKTERMYRWFGPDGQMAPDGRVPAPGELAELPESWYAATAPDGARGGAAGSGGSGSGKWTNPEVDALLEHGVPAGMVQDEVLKDLVWKLVGEGQSDAQIQLQWIAVVGRTPQLRPDKPWTDADFRRHLAGARAKLGDGAPPMDERPDWARPREFRTKDGGEDEVSAALGELRFDDLRHYTQDQAGMAELLVEIQREEITWDPASSRFTTFQPDLGRWHADGSRREELRRRTRRLALRVDALARAASGPDFALAAEGDRKAKERITARMAWPAIFKNKGLPGVVEAVEPVCRQLGSDAFDRPAHLLNVPGGTFDAATGAVREARREDLLTHCTAVGVDPELAAKPLEEAAPHFHALLWRMCAAPGEVGEAVHAERYDAMRRWLGYQLHGANPEKKLGVLEGATSIGKNQVMEIVGELLGPGLTYLSAKPALLVRTKNERPQTEEANLSGVRMAVVNELTETQVLDESQVLRLVNPEGSVLEVKKLYRDPMAVRVTWKISVTTNELPRARLTDAVVERLILFALSEVSVPVAERYDVKRIVLETESEAVMAHLASWWAAWYREWKEFGTGLLTAGEARERAQRYRDENVHPAVAFVEEMCAVGDLTHYTASTDVWELCDAYYRHQHPEVDRRYTGGRRKLYEVLSALPGVERVEKVRGTRAPLLLGFRGLAVPAAGSPEWRILMGRSWEPQE